MFSVFNANLLTDMGKAIAMKHLNAADAQAVWQELNDHISISSKGTNDVLDDSFKGSTEQVVLYFNEHFRQLDETSDDSEKFPAPVKLTFLGNAVQNLDEFQSTTQGHGSSITLLYQTYYNLLINAHVMYDKLKRPM